ncbi:DUF4214 domain-containing protein [uncultured Tateyamaria sp.]|uniref:DUF4214 domain-containing protein n=1 Tax=uncultured Tateyamaria sp. TaxID=455651 RepID=UPI00262B7DA0|nr:DUF4214 domain-containing protein [uncultured Tateyamaria sp.]
MAQVIAPVGGGSNNGEVVQLDDGGYMVVWTHLVLSILPIPNVTDDQFLAVLGRTFNADGTPRGDVFQINSSTNQSGQNYADVAVLSNGNVVVSWTDGPDFNDGFDVSARARVLTADGVPVTDEIILGSVADNDQNFPKVVATENGGFIATWQDGRFSNTDERAFVQAYDAMGNPVGDEMHILDWDSTQDGEFVYVGNGQYHLEGNRSLTFNPDVTYDWFNGIRQPVQTGGGGPGNGFDGGFEDDMVSDGQGMVYYSANGQQYSTVSLTAYQAEVRTQPAFTYSDGTVRPTEHTILRDSLSAVTQTLNIDIFDPGINGLNPGDYVSTALTLTSDGNLALVWTGISGGTTAQDLEFSVYLQIVSPEMVVLSEQIVIEDQNVVGTDIYPPFVTAGADGRLFIGWTGTTDRNGPGTNEVMGGVFDMPTLNFDSRTTNANGPDAVLGTVGDDTVTATDADELVYLFGGNDTWEQNGANITANNDAAIYGMGGNDYFAFTDGNTASRVYAGLGYDTFDYSGLSASAGVMLDGAGFQDSNRSDFGTAERVIGSFHDDQFRVRNGEVSENLYLHTEAGNDTVQLNTNWGGEIDGGAGTDVLTSFFNRADWELTFHGDHYTLAHLFQPNFGSMDPAAVNPDYVYTLRAFETIEFADETVTLQATASNPSGAGVPPVLPAGPTEGNDTLTGTANDETINALGGDDLIINAGGGSDRFIGGAGEDTLRTDVTGLAEGDGITFNTVTGVHGRRNSTVGQDTIETLEHFELIGEWDAEVVGGAEDNIFVTDLGDDTLISGGGNDTLNGGGGDDIYTIDPRTMNTVEIFDSAGNDTLEILDYPGLDVMNFVVAGGTITHQSVHGHNTVMQMNGAVPQIETVRFTGLNNDGSPRFQNDLALVTTQAAFTRLDALYAGTDGDNVITAPSIPVGGVTAPWGLIFGNGGHDDITLSSTFTFDALGGSGNDTIRAQGDQAATMLGGSGNDMLIGAGGGDAMLGQTGNDVLLGEALEVGLVAEEAGQAYRMYQAALGRTPDTGGHYTWTERLVEGGFTLDSMANAFVNSVEFGTRFGGTDTEGFVRLMYNNVLGRDPDAAGAAGWADRLDNQGWTRAEVVLRFSESTENRQRTADATEDYLEARTDAVWSDDVFRVYQATLGRTPDLVGFEGWTERMGDGRELIDMVTGFVNSTEFQTRYASATDSATFVTLIYNNVLNRNPDPVGGATWIDRLDDQGFSRAEVVLGIAQSAEFITNSTQNLIDWMRGQGIDDTLNGGVGDDVLVGGMYSDEFQFGPAESVDRVTDLEAWDVVSFNGFGYGSDADVRAHLSEVNGNVVFSDQATTVTFEGATLAMFTDDLIQI